MHPKKKNDEVENDESLLSVNLRYGMFTGISPFTAPEIKNIDGLLEDSQIYKREKKVRSVFQMSDMGKVILILLAISVALMIWIFNDSWFGL